MDLPGTMGKLTEPPGYAVSMTATGTQLLDRIAAAVRAERPNLTITTEISELGGETIATLSVDVQLVVAGARAGKAVSPDCSWARSATLWPLMPTAPQSWCAARSPQRHWRRSSWVSNRARRGARTGSRSTPPLRSAHRSPLCASWWPEAAYSGYGG
jgi:hypothetical protein